MLTDTQEKLLRNQILVRMASPLFVVLFSIAIVLGPRSLFRYFLWGICVSVHFVSTCILAQKIGRFLHRLKGEKKEEFVRLYRHIHDCSKVADIIEIAITIDDIAILIEDEYSVVRDFLSQSPFAASFLIFSSSEPLLIPPAKVLIATLYILRAADLEDLSEYLSSELYWVRDAASLRLEELHGTSH